MCELRVPSCENNDIVEVVKRANKIGLPKTLILTSEGELIACETKFFVGMVKSKAGIEVFWGEKGGHDFVLMSFTETAKKAWKRIDEFLREE